ncbi:hypothetical protein [Streptomyces subrutilus]|uniref:Uncharacterized protein n=1 Tax=Streptomyces subrutilus TaxID=36818 RepID=A0A5P2URS5_9ACTN|nr:hypothetical protein [Streptomyces subrutilus]QEU81590.1 hypothetical protein CP968_27860 [Streptomyces subrutilus]WSJ29062.1 hypothetical protein OG479_06900 [Streptomyces subrutilus]GGZ93739.1 hypothetical protein GCM10010371_61960 [Streptomyces subrutilus]
MGETTDVRGHDVTQFRSASFGSPEEAVKRAISADFGVPETEIHTSDDAPSGLRTLEVRSPDVPPLGAPATVRYRLGYRSQALTRVDVEWTLPQDPTAEEGARLMTAVSELATRLGEDGRPAGRAVAEGAVGDVEAGASVPSVSIRGVAADDTEVALPGVPLRIRSAPADPGGRSTDVAALRGIRLGYRIDAADPDVRMN